jgi:hypothetical protein
MIEAVVEYLVQYAGWIAVGSILSLVVGIVSLPFLVSRIPADYFSHGQRHRLSEDARHPAIRLLLAGIKNAIGAVFVVAGLIMLVLPGQGLLTLFIGLLIMNYPGKFALERWLIRRPYVMPAVNRLRDRYGHPPLEDPEPR